MTRYSSPSSLTSVPAYFANSTVSPLLTSISTRLPLSSTRPGPTASTEPSCGFSLAVSGSTMPLLVISSFAFGLTITRSPSGFRLVAMAVFNPLPRLSKECLRTRGCRSRRKSRIRGFVRGALELADAWATRCAGGGDRVAGGRLPGAAALTSGAPVGAGLRLGVHAHRRLAGHRRAAGGDHLSTAEWDVLWDVRLVPRR